MGDPEADGASAGQDETSTQTYVPRQKEPGPHTLVRVKTEPTIKPLRLTARVLQEFTMLELSPYYTSSENEGLLQPWFMGALSHEDGTLA